MNEELRRMLVEGEQAGSRYQLAVPRNVPTGMAGMQLGQQAGSSLEFKDHRDYQPGDDLRRIDWSAYARSDRLVLKLYREEVNPHLDVLIDGSRSMALPGSRKAAASLGVGATFVSAATGSGYTHSAYMATESCLPVPRGSQRPTVWGDVEFSSVSHPGEALANLPPRWRGQGIRVLISDLLWLDDPMATLDYLVQGAAATFIVQILAAQDVEPSLRGNVRLVDQETGEVKEVFVDAVAEKRYRENLARHQENWNNAARQVGAVMTTLIAEDVTSDWKFDALIEARILTVT